jgi:hypothetical protein
MAVAVDTDPLDEKPGDLIVPWPLVDWPAVVRAADPTREPTRGRLRELRKQGRLTDGITVTRRGGRGFQGRANYYSVLSALAERCRQDGNEVDATALARSASELEARFRDRLQAFFATRALADLGDASFSEELAIATAKGLGGWRHMDHVLLASAVVASMDGDIVRLRGASPKGLPVDVDLPRPLVERHSLTPGDLAWVFSRVVGDAALVEIIPALRVPIGNREAMRAPTAPGVQFDIFWHGQPLAAGDDGLTDDERAAYAKRYRDTGAASLTDQQTAAIKAAAGEIPRRRLRPAG